MSLRDASARINKVTTPASVGPAPPAFDPMVTAQLVLYMKEAGKVCKHTPRVNLHEKVARGRSTLSKYKPNSVQRPSFT